MLVRPLTPRASRRVGLVRLSKKRRTRRYGLWNSSLRHYYPYGFSVRRPDLYRDDLHARGGRGSLAQMRPSFLYQSSDRVTYCCPIATRDGHDFPWLIDERIRVVTAVIDDVVERWRNIGFASVLPKFGTVAARLARRSLPGARPPQRRARPQA